MEYTIRKKGNYFVAYNKEKVSMGRINIATGKFIGATMCMLELTRHLEKYHKTLRTNEVNINLKLTFADKTISEDHLAEICQRVVETLMHECNHGNGIAPEDADTFTDEIVAICEDGLDVVKTIGTLGNGNIKTS